ncbi:hypothetical protein B0H17DRAFT_1148345 [Mycena rosella]|uniref:Uncharacterized protein n=1 Tax=Mycena rosella TaxID=1033263 RepID=A0AAD7CF29_MYCRO|nr:hypothetical protein B0H17DRAFT_1148345 [Mycena rosella]
MRRLRDAFQPSCGGLFLIWQLVNAPERTFTPLRVYYNHWSGGTLESDSQSSRVKNLAKGCAVGTQLAEFDPMFARIFRAPRKASREASDIYGVYRGPRPQDIPTSSDFRGMNTLAQELVERVIDECWRMHDWPEKDMRACTPSWSSSNHLPFRSSLSSDS